VIYAADDGTDRQMAGVMRYIEDRDYEVVGTAEGFGGWISANAMLATGEADVVVFASRHSLPASLESVTAEIRPASERRPKRLR